MLQVMTTHYFFYIIFQKFPFRNFIETEKRGRYFCIQIDAEFYRFLR